MNTTEQPIDLNRRDFLRGSSFATFAMLMGGVPIACRGEDKPKADDVPTTYKAEAHPVNCAVIGCGAWGREILKTLATLPHGPVVAIAENYEPWLRRAGESAPKAQAYDDYRKVLEQKDVQAVIISTPSHQHRQVVLDALQAGKHVYCEAPLAHTIEDAKAIAKAARDTAKLNFQVGLQNRADPQLHHLAGFVRTGVLGKHVKIRSQWHKKQSWRRTSPNPEREKDLNWRLSNSTSPGLVGELGIHQVDLAAWYLLGQPVAVTGFGSTVLWSDGRDVPESVQAIFEFPNGASVNFEGSLATSFDGSYDLFYGTDSTIMLRERRAWMFKEVDAPLLGWEVYARKEAFYKESGIVLGANATKLAAQGDKPVQDTMADTETALQHALKAFLSNTYLTQSGVEDFAATFDVSDTKALREYLAGLGKSRLHAASYEQGYEATVMALKANEAIVKGQRVAIPKELFALD